MKTYPPPRRVATRQIGLAALLAVSTLAAHAAEPAASAAGNSRYEQERARCLAGQSGQALDTCLREAGAAKQQGTARLTQGDGQLAADAKKRCEALTGSERRDCLARVESAPNTSASGSVKSGGILRETVTTTTTTTTTVPPAPPPAGASGTR